MCVRARVRDRVCNICSMTEEQENEHEQKKKRNKKRQENINMQDNTIVCSDGRPSSPGYTRLRSAIQMPRVLDFVKRYYTYD